jgi:hypothetical protein
MKKHLLLFSTLPENGRDKLKGNTNLKMHKLINILKSCFRAACLHTSSRKDGKTYYHELAQAGMDLLAYKISLWPFGTEFSLLSLYA